MGIGIVFKLPCTLDSPAGAPITMSVDSIDNYWLCVGAKLYLRVKFSGASGLDSRIST